MRVLLVEDEVLIRLLLTEVMADAGFDVIEAPDAATALALSETTPCPELVVSDVNLGSSMDGFALVAAIRRRWPTVPALLMSGLAANFAGRRSSKTERFLSKPFTLEAFVQHVIGMARKPEVPL